MFNYLVVLELLSIFKKGQSRPLSLFSNYNFNNTNWKSVDGVLGIRTQGRRMDGADETTELWRPPLQTPPTYLANLKIIIGS